MARKHGSLAHSGKVKLQTPKVDKTPRKHKLKVGRAKKRLLYKRRVLTPSSGGKRRFNQRFYGFY